MTDKTKMNKEIVKVTIEELQESFSSSLILLTEHYKAVYETRSYEDLIFNASRLNALLDIYKLIISDIQTGKKAAIDAAMEFAFNLPGQTVKAQQRKTASSGGEGKSQKLKRLEDETIRLYLEREWESVPVAAVTITPQIVKLSKEWGPPLAPTTSKPIEWIRAYNRKKK